MQRREREGILGRDTTGSMYASWDNHTHTREAEFTTQEVTKMKLKSRDSNTSRVY